jgi:hypothetical protein
MTLKTEFSEALEKAKGEREIHAFLKQEPLLVWSTFMNEGGHSKYVISELGLSGKYRPDFALMQSFSGGWNVVFVELEPVDDQPFKKKTVKQKNKSKEVIQPSNRLLGAIEQINDWRNFEKDEGAALRSLLADAARDRDTLYPEQNLAREPWCVKMPLRDPMTYLSVKYFIVVGRRNHFDESLIHAKAKFARHYSDVEILTYDRFTEVAENIELRNSSYKNRTIEERDKEFLNNFSQSPNMFRRSEVDRYPPELSVHGTVYKIQPLPREEGVLVDILGNPYEIYEDRRTFSLNRVDCDGLAWTVAANLESLSAAIQLAEINERFFHFYLDTEHSLDLVDGCLQFLIENPPYRIT